MWFNSEALATPLVLCTPSHASLHFAIFCACASTTLLVLHSLCMWEEDCFSFKLASFFQVIQSLDFFKQALSSAMPRASRRSVRPARSGSTSASHASRSTSPPVSEAPTEASLLSCSTYDLRYRCTQAGLDSSWRKADLVARLLNQSASSSSGSRSRSPPAPTRRLSEVMDESSLRQVIPTEVTACVAAAVQNLAPSLHLPTASATLSPNVTPHGSAPSSSTDLGPDLQLIAPTTTTTMAATLPTATVPARAVDRIIRGEYIDLSDLLPEALGLSPSAAPLQLQLGDRGAVVQVLPDSATSSSRVKRHVHDFATWMEAWTAYLFVVLSAAPSSWAPELVAYQAIITDANRMFHPDGWLAYDRQFRSAASLNKTLRWDVVEPTLWQLTMTGTKRQPCFNCQLPHPQGARCPFRAGARQQSGFTRATHKGREVCYNFNFMRCSNRQCPRTHVCLSCGGDHPRAKCPRDPQRQTTSKQS